MSDVKDILKWGMGEHWGTSPSKRSGVKADVKQGCTTYLQLSFVNLATIQIAQVRREREKGQP